MCAASRFVLVRVTNKITMAVLLVRTSHWKCSCPWFDCPCPGQRAACICLRPPIDSHLPALHYLLGVGPQVRRIGVRERRRRQEPSDYPANAQLAALPIGVWPGITRSSRSPTVGIEHANHGRWTRLLPRWTLFIFRVKLSQYLNKGDVYIRISIYLFCLRVCRYCTRSCFPRSFRSSSPPLHASLRKSYIVNLRDVKNLRQNWSTAFALVLSDCRHLAMHPCSCGTTSWLPLRNVSPSNVCSNTTATSAAKWVSQTPRLHDFRIYLLFTDFPITQHRISAINYIPNRHLTAGSSSSASR